MVTREVPSCESSKKALGKTLQTNKLATYRENPRPFIALIALDSDHADTSIIIYDRDNQRLLRVGKLILSQISIKYI